MSIAIEPSPPISARSACVKSLHRFQLLKPALQRVDLVEQLEDQADAVVVDAEGSPEAAYPIDPTDHLGPEDLPCLVLAIDQAEHHHPSDPVRMNAALLRDFLDRELGPEELIGEHDDPVELRHALTPCWLP